MNKVVLIAAVGALVLTACHPMQRFVVVGGDGDSGVRAKPDPKEAGVYVDERRVLVDQEPIYAKNDPDAGGKKKIKWKLEQGYEFPEDGGIEICPSAPASKRCATAPRNLRCTRQNARTTSCTYDAPEQRDTIYFYTIRVKDGSSILALDPTIMN